MALKLVIDVYGDKQFAREILRIGDRAENMSPALTEVADDFLDIERKQFATEGAYASGGWAPLRPGTVAFKALMGYDPRILHRTRVLRRSLTRKGAEGMIREISDDELKVGTDVRSERGFPYAAAHQNPLRGQTRRRPIELTRNDRRRWIKILQRYLVSTGQMRRTG